MLKILTAVMLLLTTPALADSAIGTTIEFSHSSISFKSETCLFRALFPAVAAVSPFRSEENHDQATAE
jgi:hypothetical protein